MVGFQLKRHSRYLALAGHLVLGKENPGNMSKRLEEFLARMIQESKSIFVTQKIKASYLQVGFLGIFREIRHPDGSSVFPPEQIEFCESVSNTCCNAHLLSGIISPPDTLA